MANRILLKRTSVANAAPLAADLAYGELAINYNTGALYFKNSSDNVQVIATVESATGPGGANTQIQFNDGGIFGGSSAFAFNKTTSLVSVTGNVSAQYYFGDGSYLTGLYGVVGTYFFANAASSVSPYQQAVFISNYTAGSIASTTTTVTTTPTLLKEFLTNVGFPNQTYIPVGVITVDYETQKTSGVSTYTTYAEIYKRTAAGAETLLLTTDVSSTSALNSLIQQTVSATNSTAIPLNLTDRIAIKIYGQILSGASASIAIRWDDATGAGFNLPSPPASITQFVPYTNATANVDLDGYGITANYVTTVGNVTAGNVYANSGTISANLLTGTLTTNAQPNITSVGTLTSLAASGNITGGNLASSGNISATGNVSATYYLGNGSQLSGIFATSLANGTSSVTIPEANGNVNLSVGSLANVVVATQGGASVVGNVDTDAVVANWYMGTKKVQSGYLYMEPNVNSVNFGQTVLDGSAYFIIPNSSTWHIVNLGGIA